MKVLRRAKRLFGGLLTFGRPIPAVPQLHRSAAILTLRNGSLEIPVVEWVVFDFDGKTLVSGIVGRATRDSP